MNVQSLFTLIALVFLCCLILIANTWPWRCGCTCVVTPSILQVCELDIIFNFEKAYFMLDELMVGGEVCETSKKNVLKAIAAQDLLQEVSYGDTPYEM